MYLIQKVQVKIPNIFCTRLNKGQTNGTEFPTRLSKERKKEERRKKEREKERKREREKERKRETEKERKRERKKERKNQLL